MGLTVDDCKTTAALLDATIADIPASARAVRVLLRKTQFEYQRAAKMFDIAEENGADPEIVPVGGLGSGDRIQLAGGIAEVRRMSETGIEVNVDGYWGWENISGRTCPMVAVR